MLGQAIRWRSTKAKSRNAGCGSRGTQREIAEHFGLRDKYVVKQLLMRERRKEKKIKAGILPRSKGRPRKNQQTEKYELERLRMENKLLRDFLQFIERK